MEGPKSSAVRVLVRPPSAPGGVTSSAAASASHADPPSAEPSPPSAAAPSPSSSGSPPAPRPPPEGVAVVGFVGAEDDVAHLINRILDASIFGAGGDKDLYSAVSKDGDQWEEWFRHRRIRYYHEQEKGIVFLQFSTAPVMQSWLSGGSGDERWDGRLDSFLEESDSDDLRGLLLMFSVCHVIIFLHEGMRFDTHLLKKFRILQCAKHALAPFIRSHIMSTMAYRASPSNTKPPVQIKSSASPGRTGSSRHGSAVSPGRTGSGRHGLAVSPGKIGSSRHGLVASPGRTGSSRHGSAISLMSGSGSHPSMLPGQCIPAILFVFLDDSFNGLTGGEDSSDSHSISQSSSTTSVPRPGLSSKGSSSIVMLSRPMNKPEGSLRKKLQASLEAQIRFLIKKCRILSNVESGPPGSRSSANAHSIPLFSLDSSRVAVLLDRPMARRGESLDYITDIIELILNSKATDDMLESNALDSSNEDIQSIKDFISRQTDALRGRGSIPSSASTGSVAGVGMVAAAAAAAAASAASGKPISAPELPSLEKWLSSSRHILEGLLSANNVSVDDKENMKIMTHQKSAVVSQDQGAPTTSISARESAITCLEGNKGLSMEFSMSWCQRALPAAKEIYLKELPACYPTALHRTQLEKALNAFFRMVKGPAVQIIAKRLEEECTSMWESGRQLCDAISLTGKPCMHQMHHFTSSTLEKGDKKHSSGFVFLHACACGRSRRLRDDPFDFDSANLTFSCFPKCENHLPRLVLPEGNKIGPLPASSWILTRLGGARYYDPSKGLFQSGFRPNENFLLKWTISLQKHGKLSTDTAQSMAMAKSYLDANTAPIMVEETNESDSQLGTSENDQRKTTENITSGSSINFGKGLPSFVIKKPFSEVVAGPASQLQHKKLAKDILEKDVSHKPPNDITNDQSHPADESQVLRKNGQVPFRQNSQNSFRFDANTFLQIGSNVVPVNLDRGKKTKAKHSLKQVIVYIGFEYECPCGHRFILSKEHLKELDSSYSLQDESHYPPAEAPSSTFAGKSNSLNRMRVGMHGKSHFHSDGKISPSDISGKRNKFTESIAAPNPHLSEKESNQPNECVETPREINPSVSLDDGSSAFSLLNRNLPVYMKCPHCTDSMDKEQQKYKFASTISQLQRIFLVTPPFPFVLTTCPIIQFEDSCLPPSVLDREQQSQFSPGCPIILPPKSFVAFRLPFIYGKWSDDGNMEPLRLLEQEPELTASLVKGTALQLISKEFDFTDHFTLEE
ncbi:unnamed protein product [Spirodela intermedia]|uniref:Nonsense-mediated mRNA decay factor SMG8 n=1 Tax=Spirodela intermedia TaxID=51605 RepID=A0A7I8LMS6_SPIIN|nr:unnamed protein product [Spirodela intermedia]